MQTSLIRAVDEHVSLASIKVVMHWQHAELRLNMKK